MTVCVLVKCYNDSKRNTKERGTKVRKESEDKAERILSIYSKLKQGKVIYREYESEKYQVSVRTIQRDISDIQCFLQNQQMDSGEIQEIDFDKNIKGYILQTRYTNQLEGKEILAIAKILLDSRALIKSELFPIINKLIGLCRDDEERKLINDLLKNEIYHFVELQHGKQLLEKIWELEQAVNKQRYVEIKYKRLKNQMIVSRKIKPVGVIFSGFYFYLTAFIEDIDKEEHFQNPSDISPTIYRIDRLLEIKLLGEHFLIPYSERFEEGEFRKRVQFMYGGKLRKIRLKSNEQSLEAILDRLPTAEVLYKEDNKVIIQAEVFGDGIDFWVNGQGNNIEII